MSDPRWITFKQAKDNGYSVKKGVKGSQIFRLVRDYDRIQRDENKNPILDENGKEKMETIVYERPMIKLFTVFNARDIDGIEPFKQAEISEEHKALLQKENYKNAEIMVKAFCEKNDISLQEMASEQAFHQYNNGAVDKKVVIPLKSQFNNLDGYFSTLFHEVGHSTKHLGIRINKETDTPQGNVFGEKNYAKEELTAELTALMLCKQFGIDSTHTAQQNSFAYLKSWINAGLLTKDDFYTATIEANRASKAIFEYAPEMSLNLETLQQNQEKKGILQEESAVLPEVQSKSKTTSRNLITDSGETITKIRLLYAESRLGNQTRDFKTNLNTLQKWFVKNYEQDIKNNMTGYSKNDFEITYLEKNGEKKQFKMRIDVGLQEKDFNPLTQNVKQYMEFLLDRKLTEQQSIKAKTEIKKSQSMKLS